MGSKITKGVVLDLWDFFAGNSFEIPGYQRGYSWGQKELADLWDDIALLSDGKRHYMGVLTLKVDQASKFMVVDGQQRLTTLIIFLENLAEVAEKKGLQTLGKNKDGIQKIKDAFLFDPATHETKVSYLINFDATQAKCLAAIMKDEDLNPFRHAGIYSNNLVKADDFFYGKLAKLDEGSLSLIFDKLTYALAFNIYLIDDSVFDENVLFETINNRGKKLSYFELLKNRLVYLASTIIDSKYFAAVKREDLIKEIETTWSFVYTNLGKTQKPLNEDAFLKLVWDVLYLYPNTKGNNYTQDLLEDRFNQMNLKDKENVGANSEKNFPKNVEEFAKALEDLALPYVQSFDPASLTPTVGESQEDLAEEKEWIERLNRLGLIFRPLVVVLLAKRAFLAVDERLEILRKIENLIFIKVRLTDNGGYRSEMKRRAAGLFKETDKFSQNIKELKNALDWSLTPEQKQNSFNSFANIIETNFKERKGFYSGFPIKYFLYEYEVAYAKEKQYGGPLLPWLPANYYDDEHADEPYLSIEHIFPQTSVKYYWNAKVAGMDSASLLRVKNSLGNLTLLENVENEKAGNKEFLEKAKIYRESRSLVTESIGTDYVDWNIEDIYERGKKLLDFLVGNWGFKPLEEEEQLRYLGLTQEIINFTPKTSTLEVFAKRSQIDLEKKFSVQQILDKKEAESVTFYDRVLGKLLDFIPDIVEEPYEFGTDLFSSGIHFADFHIGKKSVTAYLWSDNPEKEPAFLKSESPENAKAWGVNCHTTIDKSQFDDDTLEEKLIALIVDGFSEKKVLATDTGEKEQA